MDLQQRVAQLAQELGADVGDILRALGQLPTLTTATKSDLVSAVNEIKGRVDAEEASRQYEHSQTVQASSWTVNHNLNRYPQVAVLSAGGVEMWAETIHTSLNQVMVYFDQPTAGTVICT